MKKGKKLLVVSALIGIMLGIGGIGIKQYRETLPRAEKEVAMAYSYAPNNILDNVYHQNGLTILPFIYQSADDSISKDKIVSDFKKAGLTIKSISTTEIGTGTKIVTDNETYHVLVFGDVDGDGCVDVFDSQAVLLHYVFGGKDSLTGIYKLAANVDNDDDEIDVFDAQRILLFYVGYEDELVGNEPISDKEKDKEKPVIKLKGANPQRIKLGSSYTEFGATVTDNLDKNVKLVINASAVNTNKVGIYMVTYNAQDASGNKAVEVKRTVVVEDYDKEIQVVAPSKTTYTVGEALDVTGGKVKIIKASGASTTIDMKKEMLSGYNPNKEGTQTITVTYEGKTATFKVNVVPQADYITDITITNPRKVDYKYGETIDLTGATYKMVMHSGIETAAQPITMNMLNITKFTTIGKVEITVSYTTNNTVNDKEVTFTKKFEVNVSNYVKGITLTPPTKTSYKYGETIDKTGMVVKAIMADNTEEDVTKEVSLNIGKVDLTTNKVIVKYETNHTLDGQTKSFTKEFGITVENYIKDIEIATNPTKLEYKEGESISKQGMVIKAVKANGEKEVVDLANVSITPAKATIGMNTITARYVTNKTIDGVEKTFEKTFDISIVKSIQQVLVTEKETVGERYETIEIATVKSGMNEEAITKECLEWEIKDSSGQKVVDTNIAKVTVTENQFTQEITMYFKAKIAGRYTVTPKVGNIKGNTITVEIDESSIVNKINLGEVDGNFRVDKRKELTVSFAHEYEAGVESAIQVQANRVTVEGMEYELLTADGSIIDVTTMPNLPVSKIQLKGTTVGSKTVKIIVDKGTQNETTTTKEINVLPEAKVAVKVGNITQITLYTENPGNDQMIQEENGKIYTLIPIWLEDEDGIKTKVTRDDITNEIVRIVDSQYNPDDIVPWSYIELEVYKLVSGTMTKVTGNEDVEYVGIAAKKGLASYLKNEKVVITYKDSKIELPINIPRKEIEHVIVTPKEELIGYRYKTMEIATVTSGAGEYEITTTNLEWEIRDSIGQTVSNKEIAEVTVTESQFDEEVIMSFKAKVAGTYRITPKVGNIKGTAITVEIDEDPVVTRIDLEEIAGSFRVGEQKDLEVNFVHEYETGVESTIEVQANRITVEGMDYELLTKDDIIIDVATKPNLVVGKIKLKGTTAGNNTVKIIVDKGTLNEKVFTKEINIVKVTVKVGDINEITLYTANPGNNQMVQEENGKIYTLIPIYLEDEAAVTTKVTQTDFTNGTIQIVDGMYDPTDEWAMSYITTPLFYKLVDGNIVKVVGTAEEADYVGISAIASNSIMNGNTVVIQYKGETVKTLTVNVK